LAELLEKRRQISLLQFKQRKRESKTAKHLLAEEENKIISRISLPSPNLLQERGKCVRKVAINTLQRFGGSLANGFKR